MHIEAILKQLIYGHPSMVSHLWSGYSQPMTIMNLTYIQQAIILVL